MIQVLIVADSKQFIQRVHALLEDCEGIVLHVVFHSLDIFDAYIQYVPDIILIDHKISLPLHAILKHFESHHWNCLFFIDKKLDFLTPTSQTVYIDLEQDNLYRLIQQYSYERNNSVLPSDAPLYVASPDGRNLLQLKTDLYFIMMCISLSADTSPFSSDTINQIKNAVKVVGNFEIFRILERNMMIVMRKSQMNPSMYFNEIYSIVCRITGIPYSAVWKGPILLDTVEDTCKSILDISERCYCFGPKCYTLQNIDTITIRDDVTGYYHDFVKMTGLFFEHDLKSFTACIRDFFTGRIISDGNPVALECLHEWLSFAEDALFKRYTLNKDFQYAAIYGSAEKECDRIIAHWSEIFLKYDRYPYRPATVQALYCLLESYSEPKFSLDEASRKIKFSKTYMSRFIKDDIDQSFGDLLLKLRIRHSVILLKMTSKTVKEIALDVGYTDAQYFSKVFKKQTGMHPTDFRQHFSKRGQS